MARRLKHQSSSELDAELISEQLKVLNLKCVKKKSVFESGHVFDVRAAITDCQQLTKMAFNGQLDEALKICSNQKTTSWLHAYFEGMLKTIKATDLNPVHLDEAIEALKFAANFMDSIRKKSWTSWIVTPDYNSYTDEECMAEMFYGLCLGPIGTLSFIKDNYYSPSALANVMYYGNRSFRSYCESEKILKHRTEWQSELAKINFEAAIKTMRGAYSLSLKFAPKVLSRILSIFGMKSSKNPVQELTDSALNHDNFIHLVAIGILIGYYGFVIPLFGSGELDLATISIIDTLTNDLDPEYGAIKFLFEGLFEMFNGNVQNAINKQLDCEKFATGLGNLKLITYSANLANYMLIGDWEKARNYLNPVQSESSLINYLYGSLLMMIRNEKIKNGSIDCDMDDDAINRIKKRIEGSTKYHGIYVMKKLFFVELFMKRSQLADCELSDWLIPAIELIYIFNGFHMINNRDNLLIPFQDMVERELDLIDCQQDRDKFAFLTFFKGVLLRHRGLVTQSTDCFMDVLDCDGELVTYEEMVPQTYFELGLNCKREGRMEEAADWMRKVVNFKSSYVTQGIFKYRAKRSLEAMARDADQCPLIIN